MAMASILGKPGGPGQFPTHDLSTVRGALQTVRPQARTPAVQQISTDLRSYSASCLAFGAAWQAHRKHRALARLACDRHIAAHQARELGGKPLPAKAVKKLEPLNQVLARDEEFGQIVTRDHKHGDEAPSDLKWEVQRRWHSPEALLIPIAKAMAELVCSEDFSDIKACKGHPCTLFFLDRTRARARRWCSMATCGNRAKQAGHRKRMRTRSQRSRK